MEILELILIILIGSSAAIGLAFSVIIIILIFNDDQKNIKSIFPSWIILFTCYLCLGFCLASGIVYFLDKHKGNYNKPQYEIIREPLYRKI